ncbi:MAG TPA: type II toxin-antitoxin system PemK/MazF family toxin [Thiobacillus sp.]|nr:type II toxin-antitoxin system PemK/MazF family toxin [Thiobacillus sp.]
MKRGDIYFAELSPTRGSEIAKRRPVIIVSNDANNRVATTVTVVPVTSNVNKVYPFEVFLPAGDSGLPKDSKAQAQQVRTLARERLTGAPAGKLVKPKLEMLEQALRLHLGL